MGQLLGPDTFEFLAKFFLAGWLFLSARSWWVKGERPKPNEVLFEAITLSLLNQLIALLTMPLLQQGLAAESQLPVLLAEVFLQPVLLGILVGWLAERNFLPDGTRRLFMPSINPVSDSFDFAFGQAAGPAYVILRFADSETIYGYFGYQSIANNDPQSGGVFLEALFILDQDGEWFPAAPQRSAWVALANLRSIELIPEKEIM